ncbi:MAG TPA: cation diffusion facilitator family transporter [Stenotrophobium sp.]|nr:cation diffusion facilitator family transporter [Stenotrophobium sp.]
MAESSQSPVHPPHAHDCAAGHDHDHDHGHGHGHGHGAHAHAHGGSERRLLAAVVLTALFMVTEAVAGILSGSLTLLADAGHMLTDAISLTLAWAAIRISRRPADARRSYGYDRVQVLAAFVNGCTLIAISVWIVIEAALRLWRPVEVHAQPMLLVAIAGLCVNLLAFAILHGGAGENLNMRGALVHVISDLLGSIAAIIAAVIILQFGWMQADPLLSVLVSLLILRSAWNITRQSGHVLLEGAPEGLDVATLQSGLVQDIAGVSDIHHVHAWMLSPEKRMLTLHARIDDAADADAVTREIGDYLGRQHGIAHATVQIERGNCSEPHH